MNIEDDILRDAFAEVAIKCAKVGAFGRDERGDNHNPLHWLWGLPDDAGAPKALYEIGSRVLNDPECWNDDEGMEDRLAFELHLLRLRDLGGEYERQVASEAATNG